MFCTRIICAVVMVLTLSACEELSTDSLPIETPTTYSVQAQYVKGPVSGASCDLFEIDNLGQKAALITTVISVAGALDFGDDIAFTGPALIECTGGTYTDEATDATLNAPFSRAVVDISADSVFTVGPLTEIATELAAAEGDLRLALTVYNQLVASSFGLTADITGVIPTDLATTTAQNNAEGEYATVLALISQLDENDALTLAQLLQQLAEDLGDDGAFESSTLTSLGQAVVDLDDSEIVGALDDEVLDALVVAANIPVNAAPLFSSAVTASSIENQSQTSYVALATDEDGDTLSYSLSGGADQALFSIDSVSGLLSFTDSPDYENPMDANGDNDYELDLRVSDGNDASDSLSLILTVTDESQLSVEVSFPTPNAVLGEQLSQVSVTGTVLDAEDGLVSSADVQMLSVNSETATFSTTDPSRWSVQLPLEAGVNSLDVSAISATGVDASSSQTLVNRRAYLGGRTGLDLDLANGRALILDYDSDFEAVLISLDLTTGLTRVISSSEVGLGTDFESPFEVELDSANDRALVYEQSQNALMAVDLATGDRSILFNDLVGPGSGFNLMQGMVLDSVNERLLVIDLNSLIALDLNTGVSVVLSDSATGTGDDFDLPVGIALDSANGRALVADSNLGALFAVDLVSGNRTVLSDASLGTGPVFDGQFRVVMDSANGRALVNTRPGVMAVDLSSGNRTILSGIDGTETIGTGRLFFQNGDFALDSINGRVLVADSSTARVSWVDLVTGDRTALLGEIGAGDESFVQVRGIALDSLNQRVVLAQFGGLISVDLNSGDRTLLSGGSIFTGDSIGAGPTILTTINGVALDELNNRALIFASGPSGNDLVAVDLASGDRTLLSDVSTATGPSLQFPRAPVLDSLNNRVLTTDFVLGALIAVDLATGNRTVLSDASTGTGPLFTQPLGFALDSLNDRALVTDIVLGALIEVDLNTGDRAVLSDASLGSGPAFAESITGVAMDSPNERAVILQYDAAGVGSLIAVDLATGNRTVLSDALVGGGVGFNVSTNIVVDSVNNRAFVTNSDAGFGGGSLMVVELESGDRAISSK